MRSPAATARVIGVVNADVAPPASRVAELTSEPFCWTATRTPSTEASPVVSSATVASISTVPSKGATQRRTVSIGGFCRTNCALISSNCSLEITGSAAGSSGTGVSPLSAVKVGTPDASRWLNSTEPPLTKSTSPSALTSEK